MAQVHNRQSLLLHRQGAGVATAGALANCSILNCCTFRQVLQHIQLDFGMEVCVVEVHVINGDRHQCEMMTRLPSGYTNSSNTVIAIVACSYTSALLGVLVVW